MISHSAGNSNLESGMVYGGRSDHTYDRFITGEGKYPRLMFVCRKRF